MLASLSPARRRFVLLVAGAAAAAVVLVGVLAWQHERHVGGDPVAQDEPGPVLVVPGYGGSTRALRPLVRTLESEGRDATVVDSPGDGTGDLRAHARRLDRAADAALARTGASSVDVIGYSAGGVVARYWVRDLGGASVARRVLSLGSPQHGTSLASLAVGLVPGQCPVACRQLVPGSDLLRALNAGDETPDGPVFVSVWSTADEVVTPPDSARLDGALDFSVQDVCPGTKPAHGDLPSAPAVLGTLASALGPGRAERPGPQTCDSGAVSSAPALPALLSW